MVFFNRSSKSQLKKKDNPFVNWRKERSAAMQRAVVESLEPRQFLSVANIALVDSTFDKDSLLPVVSDTDVGWWDGGSVQYRNDSADNGYYRSPGRTSTLTVDARGGRIIESGLYQLTFHLLVLNQDNREPAPSVNVLSNSLELNFTGAVDVEGTYVSTGEYDGYSLDLYHTDAIYAFSITFHHSAGDLDLAFSMSGMSNHSPEKFGVDNVFVGAKEHCPTCFKRQDPVNGLTSELMEGAASPLHGQYINTSVYVGTRDEEIYSDQRHGLNSMGANTPYLTANGKNTIVSMDHGSGQRTFHQIGTGSTYQASFNSTDSIVHDGDLLYVHSGGTIREYHDFEVAGLEGKLHRVIDDTGTTYFIYDGSVLSEVYHVAVDGDIHIKESLSYSYSGDKVSNAVYRAKTWDVGLSEGEGDVEYETINTTVYTYYGSDSFGMEDELETVTVLDPNDVPLSTFYCRYYPDGGDSPGAISQVFGPDAFRRLSAFLETQVGPPTPLTADNEAVAPYADASYEYDPYYRAITAKHPGTGLDAKHSYYEESSSTFTGDGYNVWVTRTFDSVSDALYVYTYYNRAGRVMLRIEDDTAGKQLAWYTRYDEDGNAILEAQPSAVMLPSSGLSTLEAFPDLVNMDGGTSSDYISDVAGLINLIEYDPTSGMVASVSVQHGQGGDPILLEEWIYTSHTEDSITAYLVSDHIQYGDTGVPRTTQYDYVYFADTNLVKQITTTLPTISIAQNGSGIASVSDVVYNKMGLPVWRRDAAGVISYTAYDLLTGATIKTIVDVDTSQTADFVDLPSGWSHASMHLTTTYEVDVQGRTTKTTDPKGNTSYIVYDDVNHAVFMFSGVTLDVDGGGDGTLTTTGPITMSRSSIPYTYDNDGDFAGTYDESITFSGVVTVENYQIVLPGWDATNSALLDLIGTGDPGTPQFVIQSLSRTLTDFGGLTLESNSYSSIDNDTYLATAELSPYSGALNTNYNATRFGYSLMGRQVRTVSPTGTISWTVYDRFGRVKSEWIGTNDNNANEFDPTGGAAEGNNMRKISENIYDNGRAGDGNLTRSISFPGGSEAPRNTIYLYDWRDRLVTTQAGLHYGMPEQWTAQDIDSPDMAGSSLYNDTTWVINAGGMSIGGTADEFHFNSYSANGDMTLIARIDSVSSSSDSARVGLMIRESSAAGSKMAFVYASEGGGLGFQYRTTTDASAGISGIFGAHPVYLKLVRSGNSFSAYYSEAGDSWTQLGTTQVFSMDSAVLAGIAGVNDNSVSLLTAEVTMVTGESGPLTVNLLNNLNETTASYGFNWNGVTLIDANVDGIPDLLFDEIYPDGDDDPPAGADDTVMNLVSFSTATFDDQGRAFERATYSVDPETNTITSDAIISNAWFDARGQTIKSSTSGSATTKTSYDYLGRVAVSYVTDGGGDLAAGTSSGTNSSWTSATNVAGDNVLEEVKYTYDANSNLILTTTFERMHDAYSETGPLGPALPGTVGTIYNSGFESPNLTGSSYQATPSSAGWTFTGTSGVTRNGSAITGATGPTAPAGSQALYLGSGGEISQELFLGVGEFVLNFKAAQSDGGNRSFKVAIGSQVLGVFTPGDSYSDFYSLISISGGDYLPLTFTALDGSGSALLDGISITPGAHARVSYMLGYFDAANRPIASIDLGTNGGTLAGALYLETDSSPANGIPDILEGSVPSRTDQVLVTSYEYNSQGLIGTVTDPRGVVSKTIYNALGQTLYSIAAWNGSFDPTSGDKPSSSSQNQTTAYTYDGSGHIRTITAVTADGSNNQTTVYTYGVSPATGSTIASNDILSSVTYDASYFAGTAGDDDFIITLDSGDDTLLNILLGATQIGQIKADDIGSLVFDGGTGNDTVTLDVGNGSFTAEGVFLISSGDNEIIVTDSSTDGAHVATINSDLATLNDHIELTIEESAQLVLNASQRLDSLTIGANSKLTLGSADWSRQMGLFTNSLSIAKGTSSALCGTLDMRDNLLVVTYDGGSPRATLESLVKDGRNTYGTWDGTGIQSSSAAAWNALLVGLIDNALRPQPFVSFQGVAIPTNSILIRTMYLTDVDYDGLVTTNDSTIFDSNYSVRSGVIFTDFDINYDAEIDSNDAFSFGVTYNTSLSSYRMKYSTATARNQERFRYDGTGAMIEAVDRNGTVHNFAHDSLGRVTADAVTLDQGRRFNVDDSVLRIETTYNSQNLVEKITSYDATSGGSIVNEIQRVYNGLGQLTAEYQSHSGAVNISTTPKVQYVYDTDLSKGSRLTQMIYPNGRILYYGYNSSSVDNAISRLSYIAGDNPADTDHPLFTIMPPNGLGLGTPWESGPITFLWDGSGWTAPNYCTFTEVGEDIWELSLFSGSFVATFSFEGGHANAGEIDWSSPLNISNDYSAGGVTGLAFVPTIIERYEYFGLSNVINRDHPESGVALTYIGLWGDSERSFDGGDSDGYNGLDRFGRVIDQKWFKSGDSSNTDRFQYAYDRNSNVIYKKNLVDTNQSELYHANASVSGDNQSAYDPLNRLIAFSRGELSDSAYNSGGLDTIDDPSREQEWELDSLGNMSNIWTDGVGSERTHNDLNQIIQLAGGAGPQPEYDGAGNMTSDDHGQKLVYDAWNRLVRVSNSVGAFITSYAYDGTGRRIVENRADEATMQDINDGSSGSSPSNFVVLGGELYFVASDGSTSGKHGAELWKHDGTTATLVKDINTGTASSDIANLAVVNGVLFFSATDGSTGIELWKSDGTNGGTVRVTDIVSGSGSSYPGIPVYMGGKYYFTAADGDGTELWKYDPAGPSVTQVADIYSGSGSSNPYSLTVAGSYVYFMADDDGDEANELWKTNGTTTTKIGGSFYADQYDSAPYRLTVVGSDLYFVAEEATYGRELYHYDGSTLTVIDIRTGSNTSTPENLTVFDGKLYLSASDGTTSGKHGNELWSVTGTSATVIDIRTGTSSSSPVGLQVAGSNLYFSANDGSNGKELWKYNGTTASLVANIATGTNSSTLGSVMLAGSTLMFTANDGTAGGHGMELWAMNGTTPTMLGDIYAGIVGSNPSNFVTDGTTSYFAATDILHGRELWRTDGTAAGTMLLRDVAPGYTNSALTLAAIVDSKLVFAADNGSAGSEMWTTTPEVDFTDLYYTAAWQNIEERINDSSDASTQYVWSPVYVDAMILRDRDADDDIGSGDLGATDSGLEERIYVQHDANYNVTAITDAEGTVLERYLYDPYGQVTITEDDYTPKGGNESDVAWQYLFQGKRRDFSVGFDESRARVYSPSLMRWISVDPIRYAGGTMNLQEFIGGNPINRIDPDGRLVIFVHGIGETQHKDKAPLVLAGMQQSWAGAKLAKQAMIHFLYGPANAGDPAGQGSHRNMSAGFALKELVGNLQKFRTDNKCAEEPIYIYAYSNGAIVTYLALSFGMKVDGVVYAGAALQQNQPHRAMRSIMKNTPFLINYWSQSDTVAGLVGGVGSRGFADRSIEGLNVTQFQLPEIFHFKDDALVTAGSPVRVNGQSEWDSRFMGRIYGLDLRSASDSLSVQIHKFLGVAQNPDLYYQYESGVK